MLNRINVLEITEAFGLGGTIQAIEIRAELLNKDIFLVKVVGFYEGGPREISLRKQNVPTEVCNGNYDNFKKVIEEFKPEIIHYYRGASESEFIKNIHSCAQYFEIPIVIETNVFGRIHKKSLRKPDYTVHMSLSSMLRFSKISSIAFNELYNNNHRAIYLPVPVKKYHNYMLDDVEIKKRRQKYGIGSNDIVAVRVARPDLRKWSSRLECAIPQILKTNRNLKILFIAAPPEKEKILKRKFGEQVIFLEPTSNIETISEVYQISNFMLHSSGIGESFGLSLAEGMYWGLPVIVDSTPDMDNAQVEVVDHNLNGIIVNSVKGFIEAVTLLLNDRALMKKFGDAAHEKAQKFFADEKIAKEWEKLYIDAVISKRDLPSSIISHSESIKPMLDHDAYINFYREYNFRIKNILIKKDNFLMTLKETYLDFLKSLIYARQIGFFSVITVVKARFTLGTIFKRV